ncbi:sodium-dependent transporter [Marinobacterium arenosum]|uniref:sodium-dependent transporter n=1 Tax=Marinobacterium arenosum TaxID=2862496 RepID=UPI001C98CC4A|nr:sodium-dependent transporter [Marinobacterium arenosum]MBY4677544.1 sodium-dependent transporter [Marinobacterium arenosum]
MTDTTQSYTGSVAEARQDNPMWSGRLAFILAASGSAVGLGNIWKFPYITGENGGGAFVMVYLLCIAAIGLPIMIAEVMIGRRGGRSPINSLRMLTQRDGLSSRWTWVGWMGILSSYLILSFYSVIGGWALSYVGKSAGGAFVGADSEAIGGMFGGLLSDPSNLMLWHSVFMALVIMIVARGLKSGMEKAINILMPLLFLLLLVMVGYALATSEFSHGVEFLFSPDFSKLTTEGVLTALGHAFFTLSLGMGVMMAYGSFLPKNVSIVKTAVTVSVVDTVVALLAGLAIFPLVFANGLEPGAGPGLIFQTLPLAFGQMTGGTLFATLFFFLLVVAAVTSAISLLEPVVEWLEEQKGISRLTGTLIGGLTIWALGILTVLSFNDWADVHPLAFIPAFEGKTFFDIFDYLTANILMPLGGLFIALFVGWFMNKQAVENELSLGHPALQSLLMFVLRFITPVLVLVVFLYNLL